MIRLMTIAILLTLLSSLAVANIESKDHHLITGLTEIKLKTLKEYDAQKVYITIMNAQTGEVLASSEHAPNYAFEPGSLMKPIVYALALEAKKVKVSDAIDGHNGRYEVVKGKIITDQVPFTKLTPQEVIAHSSNIGISEIGTRLNAEEFYTGLSNTFRFGQGIFEDGVCEDSGFLPPPTMLSQTLYKATTSYGYMIKINLLQFLRAYSAFNNDGMMVSPTKENTVQEPTRVISSTTAQIVKKALLKTVEEGTGKNANIKGLEIGGKTGTAHIAKNGKYVNQYNSSFIGFANDAHNSKFIIGVILVNPLKQFPAATSAAPVFKDVVELMIELNYLQKEK